MQVDIALADEQLADLLKQTAGQILTTLPGVAVVRAAAFSAYTLPIERWATPEDLYSATGLAPATYQSSTITRRGKISRQGLGEHRDALMAITWGLSRYSTACKARLPTRSGRPRTTLGPRKHRDHRPRRSTTPTLTLDQPGES